MNEILNRLEVQCQSDLHDDFTRNLFAEAAVEIERLRKDAERYRWLRGLDGSCDSAACVNFNIGFDWIEAHGVELDEAIDAAMRE